MELAKSNMETVLKRNNDLERALKSLVTDVRGLKRYVSEHAFTYGGKTRITSMFDDAANEAEKLL